MEVLVRLIVTHPTKSHYFEMERKAKTSSAIYKLALRRHYHKIYMAIHGI